MRYRAKKATDKLLDTVRFRLDTFGGLNYQPLPWLGRADAPRGGGFYSRLSAIESILDRRDDVRTALDVGSNVGAFSIALAMRGISVIALEDDPTYYRTTLYAARKLDLPQLTVHAASLTPRSLFIVPPVDCVLFLSVWHHFVRHNGLDAATAITADLWRKASVLMFFETGQEEMPGYFGLPSFEPDAATWIERYLTETCPGSKVENLGLHAAFTVDDGPCTRTLFAVHRIPE